MTFASQNQKLGGGAGEGLEVEEAAEAGRCKQFSMYDISWIAMQMTLGCESLPIHTVNNLEPQLLPGLL